MIENKLKNNTYNLVLVAIFTVLTFLATVFIRIPVPPALGGYYHLGDAVIFVASFLLGWYAIIPAVLGSALADLTAGYIIYIPATAVIKALMAVIAVLILGKRGGRGRFIIGTVAASLFMIFGYTIFEYAMSMTSASFGAFAPMNILFNGVQAITSCPVSWLLAFAVLKVKYVQKRFNRRESKKS